MRREEALRVMPQSGGSAFPHRAATLLHMPVLRLDTTMEISDHSGLLVLLTRPTKVRMIPAVGAEHC